MDRANRNLVEAVSKGDVGEVENSLQSGADIQASSRKGNTALHLAALNGNEQLIKSLIKKGASIEAKNSKKESPLYLSASRGKNRAVSLLLKAGADFQSCDRNENTPLHCAALEGHLNVVKCLIDFERNESCALSLNERTFKCSNARNKNCETPLHLAVLKGHTKIVEELQEIDADTHAKNVQGDNSLHIAVISGNENIVHTLLNFERKRNDNVISLLDATNNKQLIPLHFAAQAGHEKIVSMLIDAGSNVNATDENGDTPLHLSSQKGDSHITVIQTLLDAGANKESINNSGVTCAHIAASSGYRKIVHLLIKAGLHRNCRDTADSTLLHYAAKCGKLCIFKELCNQESLPNEKDSRNKSKDQSASLSECKAEVPDIFDNTDLLARDKKRNTPLHVAALKGHLDIVDYILEYTRVDSATCSCQSKEALINARNKSDETPLHLAVINKHTKVVISLVKLNADICAKNKSGNTPLHLAAKLGFEEIAKVLVGAVKSSDAYETDPLNIMNKKHQTALHFAALIGHVKILDMYLDAGANIISKDENGFTPLHVAITAGKGNVLQQFLKCMEKRNLSSILNVTTNTGKTPLHYAAHIGHKELLKMLVDAGADINIKDEDGCTSLHAAVSVEKENFAQSLLKSEESRKENLIKFINVTNNVQNTHQTIIAQIDLDKTLEKFAEAQETFDIIQNIPLSFDHHMGHVELPVHDGGEIISEYKDGYIPLHPAMPERQTQFVRELLNSEKMRKENLLSFLKTTLIGHIEIFKMLIDAGADVNAIDKNGYTPLHVAVAAGKADVVQELLNLERRKNGNIYGHLSAKTEKHATPLHIAAHLGYVSILKILLNAGADVFSRDRDGDTPLHIATAAGKKDIVQELLNLKEYGKEFLVKSIASTNDIQKTPLHTAAHFGYIDIFKILLDAGADVSAKDKDGYTPFLVAVAAGKKDIVQEHLNMREETLYKLVNATNNALNTPLHFSAYNNDIEILKMLVNLDANIIAFDKNGATPLHIAIAADSYEVVQELLQFKEIKENPTELLSTTDNIQKTPLHYAAHRGHLKTLKLLLEAGADVTAKDEDGYTALHVAVAAEKDVVVQELVSFNKYKNENLTDFINAKNNIQKTPLHFAAHVGHVAILEILLDNGADMISKDKDGYTALHVGIAAGKVEVIQELLKFGKRRKINLEEFLNATNNIQKTPLHFAAHTGHTEILLKLLDAGSNIIAEDEDGYTPLHVAVAVGKVDAVQELLQFQKKRHGNLCDILNVSNNAQKTPLHFAARVGKVQIFDMLMVAGADIAAEDNDGYTPLHVAIAERNENIFRKLYEFAKRKNLNLLDYINATNKRQETPLHFASYTGNVKIIKLLVHAGANITAIDKEGNTPLHVAISAKQIDAVQELLNFRKNEKEYLNKLLTTTNNIKKAPLHIAARTGSVKVLKMLIGNGADATAIDEDGYTPLHVAVENNNDDVVDELLKHQENKNENFSDLLDVPNNAQKTSLHFAAHTGNLDIFKRLLEAGADITAIDKDGFTPLHIAVATEKDHIVHEIVMFEKIKRESCCDLINATNNIQKTPLHFAAHAGNVNVLKLFLNNGGDITLKDKDGYTPLHVAIANGRELIVKELVLFAENQIERYDNYFNSTNNIRKTPLHFAAHKNLVETLKILLEADADITAKDEDGYTPLHVAVANGNEDIVKELIKFMKSRNRNTRDVFNVKNNMRKTPLHFAARTGNLDILKVLLDAGVDVIAKDKDGYTALHVAIASEKDKVIQELLNFEKIKQDYIADLLVAKNNIGKTVLHFACHVGHLEVLKVLLGSGADILAKDKDGYTPLHVAIAAGKEDIVYELIQFGKATKRNTADSINASNNMRKTPLHFAAHTGHLRISEMLLDAGAVITAKDKDGYTPLHVAIAAEKEDIVRKLMQFIKNRKENLHSLLNARNKIQKTPLHFAVHTGNMAILKLLLDAGANIFAKDADGFTPLHVAIAVEKDAVVQELLEVNKYRNHNITDIINATNKIRKTPLHFAAHTGHIGIFKRLVDAGSNITAKDEDGFTPLHVAANVGNEKIIQELLETKEYNEMINAEDNKRRTPLHYAAHMGHSAILISLLNAGADVNAKDKSGNTPLHDAVVAGKDHIIQELQKYVEQRKGELVKFLNATNEKNATPLHIAACIGDVKIFRILMNAGANIRAKDKDGDTPLHVGIAFGKYGIFKEILRYIESNNEVLYLLNAKNSVLKTPLHLAVHIGHVGILNILLKAGAETSTKDGVGHTLLHIAVTAKKINVMQELLKFQKKRNKILINFVNETNSIQRTPLHYAAHIGSIPMFKLLIDVDADIKAKSEDGCTPLHYAVLAGKNKVVQEIVNLGKKSNILDNICNVTNNFHKTPLHIAAHTGHVGILKILVESGANVLAKDENGCTPLHVAVADGKKRFVQELLQQVKRETSIQANLLNASNYNDGTLLHTAARTGHSGIMKLLVDAGADINAKNQDGNTPLHLSAWYGNSHLNVIKLLLTAGASMEVTNLNGLTSPHIAAENSHSMTVKVFVEAGFNVNCKDAFDRTIFHYAAGNGQLSVIKDAFDNVKNSAFSGVFNTNEHLLAKDKSGNTLLHLAAFEGHLEIVRYILECNGNLAVVAAVNKDTDTPLHLAARSGHGEVVVALLEANSNKCAKNKWGYTPLHVAALYGKDSVIQELLRFRNQENKQDSIYNGHRTPLHLAAHGGFGIIVQMLIDADAYVDARDMDGNTPLHLASQQGESHLPVIKLLFTAGANIDLANHTGVTCAHFAALNGYNSIVKFALENGFHVDCGGPSGNTLLHCASQEGHSQTVNLLISKGAKLNVYNSYKITPVIYAAHFGYSDIVEMLLVAGASPENENKSVLHTAAMNNRFGTCQSLLTKFPEKILSTSKYKGFSADDFADNVGSIHLTWWLRKQPNNTSKKKYVHVEQLDMCRKHYEHCGFSLIKSATKGNTNLIKNIEKGVYDMHFMDKAGNTVLQVAYKNNKMQIAQNLIDLGALPIARNHKNQVVSEIKIEPLDKRIASHLYAVLLNIISQTSALEIPDNIITQEVTKSGSHEDIDYLNMELPSAEKAEMKISLFDRLSLELELETVRMKSKLLSLVVPLHPLGSRKNSFLQETEKNVKMEKDRLMTKLLSLGVPLDTLGKNARSSTDKNIQELKLEAIKIVSKILSSGVSLDPIGSNERRLLPLAITTNNRTLLPMLLAAGAPLTTTVSGMGLLQLAWFTPDITIWVGMVVTRAFSHRLKVEQDIIKEYKTLHPSARKACDDLSKCIIRLLKALSGEKPHQASFKCPESSSLGDLLSIACKADATLLAWYIWYAGGCLYERFSGYSPLEAALSERKIYTATRLVLDMKANPFVKGTDGKMPIDDFSDGQLLEVCETLSF
ncbi:hypothetical protein SK128_009451 [Halocaridina rubra]|uniref:Uncharacterized protein n=1 Tax=Halocaridina rubra TaxID=373956 RepID=A0AAN8X1D5_HALRR